MPDNLEFNATTLLDHDRRRWIARNRGVLREVARQLGVTRQMVSAVWRGERRSRRIEAALGRLLAPGFERRRRRAA